MLHHGEMIASSNENEYLYHNIVFCSTAFVSFRWEFCKDFFYCNKIDSWGFFQKEFYGCF